MGFRLPGAGDRPVHPFHAGCARGQRVNDPGEALDAFGNIDPPTGAPSTSLVTAPARSACALHFQVQRRGRAHVPGDHQEGWTQRLNVWTSTTDLEERCRCPGTAGECGHLHSSRFRRQRRQSACQFLACDGGGTSMKTRRQLRGTVSVTANTNAGCMSEASHTSRRTTPASGRGSYVPASGHLDNPVKRPTRATLANHRQVQVTAAELALDSPMVPSLARRACPSASRDREDRSTMGRIASAAPSIQQHRRARLCCPWTTTFTAQDAGQHSLTIGAADGGATVCQSRSRGNSGDQRRQRAGYSRPCGAPRLTLLRLPDRSPRVWRVVHPESDGRLRQRCMGALGGFQFTATIGSLLPRVQLRQQ